jgi:hypothetical protein
MELKQIGIEAYIWHTASTGSVMDDYYDCLNFYETSIEVRK